ncbi:MAG: hypothetical protein WBS20_12025, partial [Lysobacterales bacterium]
PFQLLRRSAGASGRRAGLNLIAALWGEGSSSFFTLTQIVFAAVITLILPRSSCSGAAQVRPGDGLD